MRRNGCETDLLCDDANCGACGYRCVNGRSCVDGRCTPAWQPIATADAPAPRHAHAASSLDGKFVTFGGTLAANGAGAAVNSGGIYDPVTDSWSPLGALVQARCYHAAVSTGTTLYAFGGLTDCGNGTTIGPGLEALSGGAWATVSVAGELSGRYNLPAVWTGTQLFLYGGSTNVNPAVASGGRFSPTGPSWTSADCALPACERGGDFGMFLDGNVVRVWGGGPYGSAPSGLQYDLALGTWSAWLLPSGTPTIPKRSADDGRRIYFLSPASSGCPPTVEVLIYDRRSSSWLASDASATPAGLLPQAATAWVGAEMIAWSGNCGAGPSSVGGRYQPPAPR